MQALSPRSNPMKEGFAEGGSPAVFRAADGTMRAKRGSAFAKRVASAINTKVSAAPTSIRRLQQNHRGEKTEYA